VPVALDDPDLVRASEAHSILSKPDVTVTNLSDKATQLDKIAKLDSLVQAVAEEVKKYP